MKKSELRKIIRETIRKTLLKEESECNPDLNLGAGGANGGCPNAGGAGVYGTCVIKQYSFDYECVALMGVGPSGGSPLNPTSRPDRGTPVIRPTKPIKRKGKFKLRR